MVNDSPEPRGTDGPLQVTRLLVRARGGDRDAVNELFPLVYEELRRLAGRYFRDQPAGHTLQPTALVHEAFLRIVDQGSIDLKDRAHFFAIAARIMRQVLVDHYRRRSAGKRGGGQRRVAVAEAEGIGQKSDVDILELDDALEKLAKLDERKAQVVVLRFFGGLSMPEAATALRVSQATIEADWYMARAWLRSELESS